MSAEWAAAAFAGIAAGIAILQVSAQVGVARRQATFAHIRQIAEILHSARTLNPREVKEQVMAFYGGDHGELTEGSRLYLAFLDALDLLGLAYIKGSVNKAIVREYLSGLLADPYSVSEAFLAEFRKVTRDPTVYRHLQFLINTVRSSNA